MLLGHGTAGPMSKLGAVRPPGPYLANSSGVGGGGFPVFGTQPGGFGGGSLVLEAGLALLSSGGRGVGGLPVLGLALTRLSRPGGGETIATSCPRVLGLPVGAGFTLPELGGFGGLGAGGFGSSARLGSSFCSCRARVKFLC